MLLLETKNLTKYFGGLAALSNLQFNVIDGEILGLIGPNGAGKTTLFNIITGFFSPTNGIILYEGKKITGLKPHQIARKGIARTFQASTVFNKLTVFENILTGLYSHHNYPHWKAFLETLSDSEEEKLIRQKAIELLDFTGLASQKDKPSISWKRHP